MTTLRVNTKGLTDPVVSEYIQKDFKIIFQQLEKTLNNKGAKTVTVNFQSDLRVKNGDRVAAVVSGNTANKVITFDAGITLQNDSLVNTEFQKKTFSTFSHELLHIAYPNLAGNGAVHNSHDYDNASMSDLAAELSFKAAALHNIDKLGGYTDSFEASDFMKVAKELQNMENALSSDKKTGIDFSVTKPDGTLDPAAVDRIFNELTDSSSKLHGLLPPAAKNTQYSEAFDAPDIGDEVISEWMDENGDLGVCRSVWTGDEFLDFFDWMDDGFDDPPCDEDPLEPIPMEDWWPDFPWPVWADPLAFDLDGDGLELVALSQSGASFDLDGDGFRQATAWLKGDDGFLAWDKDGNGKISDISELFGSETTDGYTVLATHDGNGDGKIDANDAIFSKLSIWRDLNGNGMTDAGELKSLGEMGIRSISLAKTASNLTVEGSKIAFTGTFERADGSKGQSGALFFETNNARSEWIAPEGFEVSTEAGLLPNVRGHGDLPDLAEAMTLDPVLLQMVTDFVMACGTLSVEDMRAALTNILFQWAGVQSVASDGRGSYVDGQHLAFVEMFYGQPYIVARNGTLISSDPQDQRNGNIIENSFNDLVNGLLARVLSGVPFAQFLLGVDLDAIYANPLYPLIKLKYSAETDTFSGDFDAILAFVHQRAPEDMAEKAHYYDTVLKVLDSLRLDYFENNKQAFHEAVIRSVQELDGISQALVQASLDFAHRIHEGVDANDTLTGGSTVDIMFGNAGNDTLQGGGGNDILIGGKGNDTLYGGSGSDTYVFNLGDGQDVFDEVESGSSGDVVLFGEGIRPEDIVVTQGNGGRDLILSIRGTTDQVTLKNVISMAYAWARIEFIRFADGTEWTYQQTWEKSVVPTDGNDTFYGDELANTMTGGAGSDTLYGRDGNDILIGGKGNDTLYGGGGSDTYVFNLGDGQDIFDEQDMGSAGDAVLFGEGIHPEDIIVTQGNGGRDLILSIRGTIDQVTLKNVISMAYAWARIEFIRFADGTQWTYQQAWEKSAVPTDGNDTLYGDELANTMTGGAGNDTLYGRDGNDTLIGGKGNDTLYGNSGGDTYVFNRGDGQDIIDEQDAGSAGDAVLFGEDVRPEDIIVTQGNGGRDLILSISGTSDQVTLKNVITSSYAWSRVEFVRFADGTEWTYQQALEKSITPTDGNDTLYGDEFANTMTGGAGNDMLYGRAGNDTFVFKPGFGHDTIGDFTAGAGIGDVVEFDQALFDDFQDVLAHAQQVGSDVVITYDTNNDLRLKNVKLANLNADDFHFVG